MGARQTHAQELCLWHGSHSNIISQVTTSPSGRHNWGSTCQTHSGNLPETPSCEIRWGLQCGGVKQRTTTAGQTLQASETGQGKGLCIVARSVCRTLTFCTLLCTRDFDNPIPPPPQGTPLSVPPIGIGAQNTHAWCTTMHKLKDVPRCRQLDASSKRQILRPTNSPVFPRADEHGPIA